LRFHQQPLREILVRVDGDARRDKGAETNFRMADNTGVGGP
jgi:hypothetical protein